MPLFSSSELRKKKPRDAISKCGQCKLSQQNDIITPKMKPSGKGQKKILIVGESPGETEDKRGIQFIGIAGNKLRTAFEKLGLKLRRDCRITNACCCRKVPKKDKGENNTPTDTMITCCRPNVFREIERFKPYVILLLGRSAMVSVLGELWKEDIGGVNKWGDYIIPCQTLNCWIVPTVHPSFVLRQRGEHQNEQEWDKWWLSHLQMAIDKSKSRPYKTVPNYRKQVEIVIDGNEASAKIKKYFAKGTIAFDYETNTLKPEWEGSQIYSCAISNGKKTIAYPWTQKTAKATSIILKDPKIKKIAANLKFEERWTRAKLGHPVVSWIWDTMLDAHILDNSSGVTSLKFQAFVRLGQEPYNIHIEPFLKTTSKTNKFNRIDEINPTQLLLYNGMDALLEYLVAKDQRRQYEGLHG